MVFVPAMESSFWLGHTFIYKAVGVKDREERTHTHSHTHTCDYRLNLISAGVSPGVCNCASGLFMMTD